MKELFKIDKLRSKLPHHMQPKRYQMNMFIDGAEGHTITAKQMQKMKDIVKSAADNADAFFTREIEKYNAKKNAK